MDKTLTTQFNNGDQPLVMAYLGDQDPLRGDSKGNIGLTKAIARAVDGCFVHATVDNFYGDGHVVDYKIARAEYLDWVGYPDIFVTASSIVLKGRNGDFNDIFRVGGIAEWENLKSEAAEHLRELTMHDLTPALLAEEALRFDEYFSRYGYRPIYGPLVAVMMGGETGDNLDKVAQKLVSIGNNYEDITFFLCPSRRTNMDLDGLHSRMQELADYEIRWFPYDRKPYNPYMGLLGKADHIVITGDSFSLVSEALFTGKNIYMDRAMDGAFAGLRAQGYIQSLHDLSDSQPFPTKENPRLDVTEFVAKKVAAAFHEWHEGRYVEAVMPHSLQDANLAHD